MIRRKNIVYHDRRYFIPQVDRVRRCAIVELSHNGTYALVDTSSNFGYHKPFWLPLRFVCEYKERAENMTDEFLRFRQNQIKRRALRRKGLLNAESNKPRSAQKADATAA